MSAPELVRYTTTFAYRGWLGLSLACYGTTFEMSVGQGDNRLTVWGKSVRECEERARRLIDKNGRIGV